MERKSILKKHKLKLSKKKDTITSESDLSLGNSVTSSQCSKSSSQESQQPSQQVSAEKTDIMIGSPPQASPAEALDNLLLHPALVKMLADTESQANQTDYDNESFPGDHLTNEEEKDHPKTEGKQQIQTPKNKTGEVESQGYKSGFLHNCTTQNVKEKTDENITQYKARNSFTEDSLGVFSGQSSETEVYQEDDQQPSGKLKLFPKMAICPNDYPRATLSENQCSLIKQSIIDSIIRNKQKGGFPRFEANYMDKGTFVAICSNEETKSWLVSTIPKLKPWEGAKLCVDEYDRVLPTIHVTFRAPVEFNYTDPNMVLTLIEGQNPGIKTQDWCIINTGKVEAEGKEFTVGLTNESWHYIKSSSNFLNLGLGKVYLTKIRKEQHNQNNIAEKCTAKSCQTYKS